MICAYGSYSASATGGNGWSRDFLAAAMTIPSIPFYSNIGPPGRHLQYASTVLFCISVLLVGAVYVIYWKGPLLRKRSPFAQHLAAARNEQQSRNIAQKALGLGAGATVEAAMDHEKGLKKRPEYVLPAARRNSEALLD